MTGVYEYYISYEVFDIRKNGYYRWFFINLPTFIGSNNEFYSASLNTERFRIALSKKWE